MPSLQAAALEPVELDIFAISLRQYVHIGGEEACCNNNRAIVERRENTS